MSLKDLITFARSVELQHEHSHAQNKRTDKIKEEHVNQVHKKSHHSSNHQNQHFKPKHQNYHNKPSEQNQNKAKSNKCGMCGYEYPHKGNCPVLGKVCSNCGSNNHFSRCCRSKNNKPTNNQSSFGQSSDKTRKQAYRIHVEDKAHKANAKTLSQNYDTNQVLNQSLNEPSIWRRMNH
jgi:hypothetical protein